MPRDRRGEGGDGDGTAKGDDNGTSDDYDRGDRNGCCCEEEETECRRMTDPATPADRQPDEPCWQDEPDEIPSTRVAALLGLSSRSLNVYVRRGQLAPPVSGTANTRNYRREDVRDFWRRRKEQATPFQLEPKAQTPGDEPLSLGVEGVPAGAMNRIMPALQSAVTGAMKDALTEANAPALERLDALTAQLARIADAMERQEVKAADSPEQKRPWWRRIFGP